jgi:hypothetical protein
MLVAKVLFNSVVSTPGAKFMTMDVSNFYLMTPLKRPEYIRVRLADMPTEIINEYKLRDKANHKGHVFMEITKGMYGLPQAGLLANELLKQRLNKHGYVQSKLVPGLWKHNTRPIQFTLVVDDFGVKYVGRQHAEHLKSVLEEHYKVTTDWSGERYIGIHLKWDYVRRRVHLHMPGYVKKALIQFQHKFTKKTKPTLSTHTHTIRSQNTIRHQNIRSATPQCSRQKIHSEGVWKVPILRQSRRQHSLNSHQRNSVTIS